MERAAKIFQHALKLDPSHVEILTSYGEFLELCMKDVMNADHYYKIALVISPENRKVSKWSLYLLLTYLYSYQVNLTKLEPK